MFSTPILPLAAFDVLPVMLPQDEYGSQAAGGAAMRINERSTVTFAADVTFSGCSLPREALGAGSGAAIANFGTLVFQGMTTFQDTVDGGALYTNGKLTFEGDALFENNKHNNYGDGNGNGAGLFVDYDGSVEFQGAASFIDNEVTELFSSAGRGAGLYSRSSSDDPFVFSGPVLFKGNSGLQGALSLSGGQDVIFESLVTFENNIMRPKLGLDDSAGGAMHVSSSIRVEFRAGVTAKGNFARRGGAFHFRRAEVLITGPVTITDNEAGLSGGAIWIDTALLTLPSDPEISGNAATFCPGIYIEDGSIEFGDGGASYTGNSRDLCYLGSPSDSTLAVDVTEDFDCEAYVATAPSSDGYPYLVLDTGDVRTWNLGSSVTGSFSCPEQLVVFVTGGSELTIISTAASATIENARFEVVGYTKLILDMPDLTIAGIYQSQLGGAVFVDRGSSMDVKETITFLGNTVAYETFGAWPERGGPAIYSAGDVKFYEKAYFHGNGQYRARANGYEPDNEPGGAVYNSGTMEFMAKGTFTDNFNPNGGEGGAIANFGELTFNLRGIFRNNSVGAAYTDDGEPYGGRGGALYNAGGESTVVFKRLAFFKNNVGALGGCALASRGTVEGSDDDYVGENNKVTFEYKAKFKDNYCDGDYDNIYDDDSVTERTDSHKGGGAILAFGSAMVEFQNTAVFKRNEAPNGGAIVNAAVISFITEEKLFMEDNLADGTCPDIVNNVGGIIQIGEEVYEGPDSDICERPSMTDT